MERYQKLYRFPLGKLHPEGFLKEQMLRNRDGMGGHLDELEPEMIGKPFLEKYAVPAWSGGDQEGWGAEISGNYWTGLVQLAFTLNDEGLIRKATKWVDGVLKTQLPNGYLGTYREPDSRIYEDYNAWGTACGMRALLFFYEATGRRDVLEAVHRCMLWFCSEWAGERKTSYAGPFLIEPMILTYHMTGDERLMRFAEDYAEYLCAHDIFRSSYRAYLSEPLRYNSQHTVAVGTSSRLPALIYTADGREELLRASERVIEQMQQKSIHLTGSPVCITEFVGPVSATAETEYCSYATFQMTYSYLSAITGKAVYGDRMETLVYNGAQGARRKDEKAIAYLNSPNQVYATMESSNAVGDMQVYAPCYPTSCCPVLSVSVLPEFVRGMILHDAAGNLYLTAYGPCSLDDGRVRLVEKTDYPFRDTVEVEVDCEGQFAIYCKVPGWCRAQEASINGERVDAAPDENGYFRVEREWRKGDVLRLRFPMETEVLRVDDTDAARKYPIALRRGVLVYALHLEEKWTPIAGNPMTKLPEGWSWFNVTPVFEEAKVDDAHEMLGLRRYHTTWNVALDEALQPGDVEVVEKPMNGYVWENPPVELHLKGYRAPFLCAPYERRTFEPFGERQFVTDELELTLVPYGCTNLRITYFPHADLPKK